MMPDQQEKIASQRERAEKHERALLPPMICYPAAGIRVKSSEQSCQRIKDPDHQYTGAKDLEIFGSEPEPKPFTRPRQHKGHQQQRRIAPERKELAGFLQDSIHD